ncbi:MAG: fibronectin type III domain-containing protein [Akkermansiaceae bacterium]|nr:fibronectin type III domain-containing protein [Akkermansiaceae bacterium]
MFPRTAILVFLPVLAGAAAEPLLLDAPRVLRPDPAPGGAENVRYIAQPAQNGTIDLTATNGFFDSCFQAGDQGPVLPGDKGLISASFGHLRASKGTGTARWHLWVPEKGRVRAAFHLNVPKEEEGTRWTVRFGNETRTLVANASGPADAQKQVLDFDVKQPGRITFTVDCSEHAPPPGTTIHFIRLDGPAVSGASLLRARWRPAAVHQRFEAPPECAAPDLWVFETRSVSETSSYSPLTTPFGYYGTSFHSDGRVPPGAGFNFSMWLASRGADHAPPVQKMPRILATGLKDASFSWFSHEGTGVKLRDAVAYPDGAERTIQAMRCSYEDGLVTYYGYFYDEASGRWVLFAAGRQPPKRGRAPDASRGLLRSTGSFCEVPGPPARQRSGDLVRLIKRRGWFIDRDRKAHPAVMQEPRRRKSSASAGSESIADVRSQRSYPILEEPGWFAMATGGIEQYLDGGAASDPITGATGLPPAPDYLSDGKIAQLFETPVGFGAVEVVDVSPNTATLDCRFTKLGPNARAIVYYGKVDGLTYPAQEIKNGSAALREMFSPSRTWSHHSTPSAVRVGSNRIQLKDLQPETRYFFRVFVEHDHGKSWNFHTGILTTG